MLLGQLDDTLAAKLEEHIGTCSDCQRVLDRLTAGDRLTDALRHGSRPPTEPALADPGVDAMVARLEDMARQFTPAGFDLSVSPESLGEADSFPSNPAHPDQMGVYRILQLLGAGGMGLVYLAEDEVLRRRVAVKVLRPRLARKTRAREGFLREARAMAALKHDNVVTVFQVGEANGANGTPVPFLAMELLEGESLADWLRREGAIAPAWAARLGRQAADGLAAAHARGVVHRDIKPGNLWLEAPPGWTDLPPTQRPPLPAVARLKVLDFGLAQPAGGDGGENGSVVLGTPAYMPPEQAAGGEVDHRADLFSLGVVLYELVTVRQPFLREGRRPAPTYPSPVPVTAIVPEIPRDFADLIQQLLSPEPADRPESARQVAQKLAALTSRSPDDTVPIAAALTTASPIRKRRSRSWVVIGTLAAVIMGGWITVRTLTPAIISPSSNPLTQPGPPNEEWVRAVAALPVDRQPGAVVAKLRELNPEYDGEVNRLGFEDGRVTEFAILTDAVSDIRPIRALAGLRHLNLIGSAPGRGRLTDLSPIHGLPLKVLNIWQNPRLVDLSPARGMSLTLFQAGDTAVEDLSPLVGMPIDILAVNNCRVRDLTPVHTMPKLRYLRFDGCPVATLMPLVGSKVRELRFEFNPARGDAAALQQMTQLNAINGIPASEFRRHHLTSH